MSKTLVVPRLTCDEFRSIMSCMGPPPSMASGGFEIVAAMVGHYRDCSLCQEWSAKQKSDIQAVYGDQVERWSNEGARLADVFTKEVDRRVQDE